MKLSKQYYTVGWICALPIERAAAIAVLDEKHDELPAAPSEEDSNIHTVGRIGKHNVVIVCLPAGNYGTNSAATVATNLRRSFPSLRFGLMVGIGGGVPNDENDARLGDIVVSQPLHGTSGVVQYDLGKRVGEDTFHRTGWLNAPPTILLNASASLQAEKSLDQLGNSITAIATEAENKDDRFSYPNTEDHFVWFGKIIASGNQVIKDAIARDKIGKEAKAICFEMEAAGLMNHFPCLVIRGVCEYSDSHKNKVWQPYAAITAAVYTKELLNHVPSLGGPGSAPRIENIDVSKSIQALASVSRDSEVEKTGIERRKDKLINGSYQWVKDHQIFKYWLTTGSQILHLIGGAGKGKTMIMIGLINEFESDTKVHREKDNELREILCLPGPVYFSYFLCQGTNEHLNSAHSVLKGLLLLLLRKHQNLTIHLQKRYDLIGADSFASMIDINLLQLVLFEILDDPSDPSVVFCIDALDECFVGNRDLMAFIRKSVDHSPRIKWLLSSRPHQDIISNYAPAPHKIRVEVILEENQDLVDLALGAYIDTKVTELDLQKHYRRQDKLDLKKALKEKRGGAFLWVHLAGKELESSQAFSHETVSMLEQIPLELTSVYTRMINQIEQLDIKTRGRCFDILETIKLGDDHLQEILLDAKEFLRHNFSRIEQSPLQIYSSAFIFSPPLSLTRKMNTHRLSGWLGPESRGSSDETWSSRHNLILQGLQDCTVISATYSPNGKLIAAFCDQIHSVVIKIWDSANGLCLHVLPIPENVYLGDSWLSFLSDNTLVSFNGLIYPKIGIGTRTQGLLDFNWSLAHILSISGDNNYSPHSWDQVQIWDVIAAKCIKVFTVPPAGIIGLFFSGHTIIAGVSLEGPAKKAITQGSGTNENNNVALSPNGETIAEIVGPGHALIKVWCNVTDQRRRQVLLEPQFPILSSHDGAYPYIKSLSFSGDSQLLLVVLMDSYGKSSPLVQIFDSSAWVCIQSLGPSKFPTTGILGAEFCPIDPDLVVLTCRDGSVRIWSLVLGQDTKALNASPPTLHQYPIDSVLVFPNSRFAASVAGLDEFLIKNSSDYYFTLKRRKEAIIWNTSTVETQGNTLISCSHTRSPRFRYKNIREETHYSRRIRVWDFETGNCLKKFELAGANDDRLAISTTINISNDTKLLATSGSGSLLDTVQLWSLHNGDCLHSFPRISRCGEYPIVEFSPDDKYIAISHWVGSSEIGSGSFEVRDTITGHTIGLFGMHSTEVISIAFSSARKMIVSASVIGDIQLFDLENKLHHETTDGSIPHHSPA
ncbi:hypothetical protein TWF106_009786 [Orbilia oligospora]|uniref:Nephrocystin 3-like N-terminal domain-containing protein n=1 Tax=Orbilia oligospora TaxID=2813651 RepID=A0A7C8QGQ1_ORBOL|nr:hypothetical protein TWF106_009786 [Orbilia oligospora]